MQPLYVEIRYDDNAAMCAAHIRRLLHQYNARIKVVMFDHESQHVSCDGSVTVAPPNVSPSFVIVVSSKHDDDGQYLGEVYVHVCSAMGESGKMLTPCVRWEQPASTDTQPPACVQMILNLVHYRAAFDMVVSEHVRLGTSRFDRDVKIEMKRDVERKVHVLGATVDVQCTVTNASDTLVSVHPLLFTADGAIRFVDHHYVIGPGD